MAQGGPNIDQYGIPGGIVIDGWNTYNQLAVDSFNTASSLINQLGTFTVSPVNFDAEFEVPPDLFRTFKEPKRPSEPNLSWEPELPPPFEADPPTIGILDDPPDFRGQKPILDFSGEPGSFEAAPPPDPPLLDDAPIPPEPTLTFPPEPQLTDIEFPDKPELLDVQFEGVRPDFEGTVPDTFIDFTEEEYQSEQLNLVRTEIKRMLENGTGMPPVIEQMLVDRARTRQDREATRAVQQAMEEASARGFTLPPGHVMRRAQEIRQNNQNQANTFNREVFIQRRQEETQNYQFAIAQGIALENILINAHLNVQQRAFEFARAVVDLHFRQLEAHIAIYNAEIEGYRVDAAVYEAKLRAEINKLEQYRLEIQAESLKIDADRAKVEIYQAQLAAVEQRVEVYKARIEAARAITEKNRATVQAYVGEIEGYRAKVEANKTEWDAWATKVRGQIGRAQAYESETRAFASEVQAYQAGIEAELVKPRFDLEIEQLRLRENLAQLERYRSEAQAEASRFQAEASVYGSEAQMFAAEGSIAEANTASADREFRSRLEANRTKAERALANAQLNVEQVIRSGQLVTQALDGAARASSQLSAGAMSAVNLAAGVSGSSSWSESHNYSY